MEPAKCSACTRKNLHSSDFYSEYRRKITRTCRYCRRDVLKCVYKKKCPSIKRIFEALVREYPDIMNSEVRDIKFAVDKYVRTAPEKE